MIYRENSLYFKNVLRFNNLFFVEGMVGPFFRLPKTTNENIIYQLFFKKKERIQKVYVPLFYQVELIYSLYNLSSNKMKLDSFPARTFKDYYEKINNFINLQSKIASIEFKFIFDKKDREKINQIKNKYSNLSKLNMMR